MKNSIVSLFTRAPLHVGGGSSVGAIDLPVVRERHTRFPVVPGSGLKGTLADLWLDEKFNRTEEGIRLFGATDSNNAKTGRVLIGEGKLLAFPVRSAKGCFAWVTCPLVLARFARDTGKAFKIPDDPGVAKAYAPAALRLNDTNVIFEEYPLNVCDEVGTDVLSALDGICDDEVWVDQFKAKLAIVSDEMFAYFAENACEVATHIKVDDETGVVKNGALFNQENVPSETLFYSVFTFKCDDDAAEVKGKLAAENNLLQLGADMTTGLGWCSVAMKEVK